MLDGWLESAKPNKVYVGQNIGGFHHLHDGHGDAP